MNIAIMQPYFFPYIGYFQLVNAADIFIFYDDVNYINKGWINRNKFLVNENALYITISCEKASQNKLISEINVLLDLKTQDKILKTIENAYKKAPFFNEVFSLFYKCIRFEKHELGRFSANTILEVCNYLNIKKIFKFSSADHSDSKGMDKSDRLIHIARSEQCENYINLMGGMKLYDKTYFKKQGVELCFLQPQSINYTQFNRTFIADLSIIDILMFNDTHVVNTFINKYLLL
jgi:hypothetical protein